jgi:CheY-like chemotaxis protein
MSKRFQKILLIDDDSVSNFLNEMALQEMNLSDQIHVSENGEEALNFLYEHCCKQGEGTENCPDLIFLDINMPVMDGFQFLEEFEKLPYARKKPVKIVMLTSSNATKDLERAKSMNVEGYIVKPLCKEKIEVLFN